MRFVRTLDAILMIRMLIVGYVFAIRSERRIYAEVQANLAYRWFCKLGIEDGIPDSSVFCRARHERFRESDALRGVFEDVVAKCIAAGLVGGEGFFDRCELDQGRRGQEEAGPWRSARQHRRCHHKNRTSARPAGSSTVRLHHFRKHTEGASRSELWAKVGDGVKG